MSNNYPLLSQLIDLESLTNDLVSLENAPSFVNQLLYDEYVANKSHTGDKFWCQFKLILGDEMGFKLFGSSDLRLLVGSTSNPSGLDIEFGYAIPIKKYIHGFNLESFLSDPTSFISLLFEIADIDPREKLNTLIQNFIKDGDGIQTFVDVYNDAYEDPDPQLDKSITINSSANVIQDLADQIVAHGLNIEEVILVLFLTNPDLKETLNNIRIYFRSVFGDISLEDFTKLLTPQVLLKIRDIAISLQIPDTILQPVDENNQVMPGEKSALSLTVGTLTYETGKGFDFDTLGSLSLQRSLIAGTGFIIEFLGLKADLSRTKNIPEADADGRPYDFIGVYVTEANIAFPADWNHDKDGSTGEIKARNLLIGTGGISGAFSLEAKNGSDPAPFIKAKLGENFEISLDAFSITFKQNSVVDSSIKGTMKIPGFKDGDGNDAEIRIDVFIGDNGEFKITASEDQGINAIHIPDVLTLTIFSLSIGKKNGKFYVAISGEINFTADVAGLGQVLPKNVQIKKLVVWDDGHIEFDAGGITLLPKAINMNIGPVKLSVSSLQLGSHEQKLGQDLRKYLFFGFDGSVNVNPGGVNVRGEGVKFYFTHDGGPFHCFLRIQRIDIDMIIPGNATPESAALLLKGYVAMTNPENSGGGDGAEEYAGGVDFKLPKLKMGGSASMRLKPKTGAFIIDAGLEMSSPIVLGTTGLGIYGFRGLIGKDYIAAKSGANLPESAPWWQYYKAPPKEGIVIDKMDDEKKGFSLGAGISLATTADAGRAFSSKLFFLLSLPEVFLLQGQAAVMAQRIGLDTTEDPPFFALLAISNKSVEAAFGAKYQIPKKGEGNFKVLNIEGIIEMAYFFGNSSGWYINIGRDQPESMRIRAEIFSLFQGYAYLMISSAGLRMGAGITWEFKKSYGPAGLELGAYMHTQGRISFKPTQIGGSLQLGGFARIRVFKFKFGFDVHAMLAAELPKPFVISGQFTLTIDLPRPFKDIKIHAELTWRKDSNNDPVEIELVTPLSAAGVNVLTKETYKVEYFNADMSTITPNSNWSVLPLDTFVDIEFTKPVFPNRNNTNLLQLGGVIDRPQYSDIVPPQKGISQQFLHEYILNDFTINYYDGSQWLPYNIYAACLKPEELQDSTIQSLLPGLKSGYWQLTNGSNQYNKLRLLSQTPFSFTTHNTEVPNIEWMGLWSSNILCPPTPKAHICQTWTTYLNGTQFSGGADTDGGKMIFTPELQAEVANPINIFGIPQALTIQPDSKVALKIPDGSKSFDLRLETLSKEVTVFYYTYGGPFSSQQSRTYPGYTLVKREVLTPQDLFAVLSYESETDPVSLVVIKGGAYRDNNGHEGSYYGSGPSGLGDYGNGLGDDIAEIEGDLATLQSQYDDESINNPSQAPHTAYLIKEKQKELDDKNDELTRTNNFSNNSSNKSNDIQNDPSKKYKDKVGETKTIVNKIVKTSRYVVQEIIEGNRARRRNVYRLAEKLSNGKRYMDMILDNPGIITASKELRYVKGKQAITPSYGKVRDYLYGEGRLPFSGEPSNLYESLKKIFDVLEFAHAIRNELPAEHLQDLMEAYPVAWYIQEAARFDLGLGDDDVEIFGDILGEAMARNMGRAKLRLRMIATNTGLLRSGDLSQISSKYTAIQSTLNQVQSELQSQGLLAPASPAPSSNLDWLIRATEVFHFASAYSSELTPGAINAISTNYAAIMDLENLANTISQNWAYGMTEQEMKNLKFAQHFGKYLCRVLFEGENPTPISVTNAMQTFYQQIEPTYLQTRTVLVSLGLVQGNAEMTTPCLKLAEVLRIFEIAFANIRMLTPGQRTPVYNTALPMINSFSLQLRSFAISGGYQFNENDLFRLLAAQYLGKSICGHPLRSNDYSNGVTDIFLDTNNYYNSLFTLFTGWGIPLTALNGNFCGDYEKRLNVFEMAHIYGHRLPLDRKVNRIVTVGKYQLLYEWVTDEIYYPFSIASRAFIKKIRLSRFYLNNLLNRGYNFRPYMRGKLQNDYGTNLQGHYNALKSKLISLGIMAPFSDSSDIRTQLNNFFNVIDNTCYNLGQMGTPDYIETINVKNKIDGVYNRLKKAFDEASGGGGLGTEQTPPLTSALQRMRVAMNRYSSFAPDIQTGLNNDAPGIIERVLETTEEIYRVTTISDDPEENVKEPSSTRSNDNKSKAGQAADHNDTMKDNEGDVPPALNNELEDALDDAKELSERIKEELADLPIVKEEAVVYHEIIAEEILANGLPALKTAFDTIKAQIDVMYANRNTLPLPDQTEIEQLKPELDRFNSLVQQFQTFGTVTKNYELAETFDFDVSSRNITSLQSISDDAMESTLALFDTVVLPVEPGSTMVYSACFTTPEIEAYNESLMGFDDIAGETREMAKALNHVVQPIWRPNTYYAIEMETIDRTNGSDTFVRKHTIGFRTKGPVGHYHIDLPAYNDLLIEDKQEQFQLKDVQQYLDFERSFPNPGSKLLNAKPMYYNQLDFSLLFKEQYLYHMYQDWSEYDNTLPELESKIELVVKGSIPDEDVENPQEPEWIKIAVPMLYFFRPEISILNAVINGTPLDNNCIQLSQTFMLPYFKMAVNKSLKPDTLYTAIWKSRFGEKDAPLTIKTEEIWRYVFQTSAYANLNDQLQSHVLSTNPVRKAIYALPVTWDAPTRTEAVKELNGQALSDATLYDKFAISFDRLNNGILKVAQLPAPETLDINVFKEGNTIRGILVRSPEPFNDPRLPKTELDTSLVTSLIVGGNPDNTPIRKVFSKDNSQVFLSNDSMNIQAGSLTLTFKFKLFDFETGDYVVKDQAAITIDLTTI